MICHQTLVEFSSRNFAIEFDFVDLNIFIGCLKSIFRDFTFYPSPCVCVCDYFWWDRSDQVYLFFDHFWNYTFLFCLTRFVSQKLISLFRHFTGQFEHLFCIFDSFRTFFLLSQKPYLQTTSSVLLSVPSRPKLAITTSWFLSLFVFHSDNLVLLLIFSPLYFGPFLLEYNLTRYLHHNAFLLSFSRAHPLFVILFGFLPYCVHFLTFRLIFLRIP